MHAPTLTVANLLRWAAFAAVVIIAGVCVALQRRALHPVAFGRSMFISATAVLMGLMVGMSPGIPATVVSLGLLGLGFGFLLFMGWVSLRHLQQRKRNPEARE